MTTYVNCNDLCKLFGLSLEEMDKILIEHGLKSGELATQKAIDDNYATLATRSEPWNHWNVTKVSELTGKKLLDEVGFYVNDVMTCIQIADELYRDRDVALMVATQAYRDVPKALWDEVNKRVGREIIGDRRQACEKCGRLTFYRVNGFCWRCLPDDPFIQQRLDYEAEAREAAAKLAIANWGSIFKDYNIEPKDTDIALWNGAVDNAIDTFLARLVNPSKCNRCIAKYIVDDSTDNQALIEFTYSGFEDYGDWKRRDVFLNLAFYTVMGVFLQEAEFPKSGDSV